MGNCTCKGTGYVNLGRPPKRFICGDCDGRGETSRIKKGDYQELLKLEKGRIKK
jgi:hypothetical protein